MTRVHLILVGALLGPLCHAQLSPHSHVNSPVISFELQLSDISGIKSSDAGYGIDLRDQHLRKIGLLDYLSVGGVCLGADMVVSVGFGAGSADGEVIKNLAKDMVRRNGYEPGLYVCISNSGFGLVRMGSKLSYLGFRGTVAGGLSVLLAIGYDPNGGPELRFCVFRMMAPGQFGSNPPERFGSIPPAHFG